ncbi:MAG: proline iminopeptidase-family hydrolase [Gammaproteobacteria bacterium]|nr:proline iminopeptidase-family hydrolase [Gammaproteobacteria bacterium]
MAKIKNLYIPFLGYKTYVRIVGYNYKKTPLIILHGGPGSTHNSLELLDELSDMDERPLIMYDQLGCGKSYIGEGHKDLWNSDTWVKELENLISYLSIKEYHLLGHSWGGMLEIIYTCNGIKREGLKSMTLSSTLASASLWAKEAERLIKYLPKKDQKIINKAIDENDYSSKEFNKSNMLYYHTYVWPKFDRTAPLCLRRKKVKCREVYESTWGPCEFRPMGNLKDYEYLDKLDRIDVPVYIVNGSDDESTPLQNKAMYDNIKSKKVWHILSPSRHMTYFERHDEYIKYLKEFLDDND